MPKILIVEDDPALRFTLAAGLGMITGTRVSQAGDGLEAWEMALLDPPDLILLDLVLPRLDGFEFCQRVRATPELADCYLMMLTGKTEVSDRLQGFMLGADDYLLKPMEPLELQMRVLAVLRRLGKGKGGDCTPRKTIGSFLLDRKRPGVEIGGHRVRLTATEFDLFCYLAERLGQEVPVDELLAEVLGYRDGKRQSLIATHMMNIRGKFKAQGLQPDFIRSSRRGYVLHPAEWPQPV